MTETNAFHPALMAALEERGYSTLTPVQQAMATHAREGGDLLVSARTGSGKTVAFGIAMAATLLPGDEHFGQAGIPRALVIAPTRELALQVRDELSWLFAGTGARVIATVGGMDMRAERRALASGIHLLVGTPGRLRDHVERGALDLSNLSVVVLDEADEMLDMGFREDLEFLLDAAPVGRRTLLFSATVAKPIVELARRYQKNARRVAMTDNAPQHADIAYRAISIAPNDVENGIVNVLRFLDAEAALIFCSTRAHVGHLASRLNNRGLETVTLSGELSQKERSHALQAMRDKRARVCIATDVAARGLDLPHLDLVIHADLPGSKDTLLHRSGRTGRAGRKGVSVLMVPHTRRRAAERLLMNAGIKAQWMPPPSAAEIRERDHARLLEDPAFSESPDEEVRTLAQKLLARHGAEAVAAAYVAARMKALPAPEELIETAFDENRDRPGRRPSFEGSGWFRMPVGRNRNADPRWILPLICRSGHVAKQDVGAIRILERETRFEIAASALDRFRKAIARSDAELEVAISEIPPPGADDRRHRSRKGPARKPHRPRR
ncbi:MAG: DEAD/DEAH box helicase [Rhodothalassiaceae bacterium]